MDKGLEGRGVHNSFKMAGEQFFSTKEYWLSIAIVELLIVQHPRVAS
jgi:hypothetical protein